MNVVGNLMEKSALELMDLQKTPELMLMQGYAFRRMTPNALGAGIVEGPEKFSLLYDRPGVWQLSNVTRPEGYELDPNSIDPLPTPINEKKFIDVMENVYKRSNGMIYGVNMVMARFPIKVNWTVVECKFLRAGMDDPWVF